MNSFSVRKIVKITHKYLYTWYNICIIYCGVHTQINISVYDWSSVSTGLSGSFGVGARTQDEL